MNYIDCPVTRTLSVMGGRWKPVLLHYLMEKPRRAGELTRLIPQASAKVLTQQLRELENDNIVHREVFPQIPPKVEYSLTDFGESLRPVMDALCEWGKARIPKTNESENITDVSSSQTTAEHTPARESSQLP
ncbi:MAG: transcriptional regulator [Verrucomicrobia bacterium 61-8]|nr:helix-turn-helix transcriptional regulator [Verrucomicrobiota bacterium]OJU97857.1 MAG: transcriptional regulator [Verrucomicrobia bacterium 61-8]